MGLIRVHSRNSWLKRFRCLALLRFLGRRWRSFVIRSRHALICDLGFGTEALVTRVLDDLPYVDWVVGEWEHIVGAGVSGEPVLAVNLFAVGHEFGR